MARLNNIYARMPVWAQHGAVSAYGLYWNWMRFGAGHAEYLKDYKARESWSAEQWHDWQSGRVRSLLEITATKVPYYRETWNANEKAAARAGRLNELPLLEKEPLRRDPKAFLREDMKPRRCLVSYTSGSTGTPITSIRTVQELRDSMSLREARMTGWAGVSFHLARATFSGRMVEPDPESTGPFHRYNAVERQVYLSPFHLRPDTVKQYVAALAKHQVRWLHGYAVSYYLLAKLMLEQNLRVEGLKAVCTTSEKVLPNMRRVMEDAFKCRVFEEYSTVENVIFASECEHGKLHASPDAGVVEILRPDGSPCGYGEAGEIVATGLIRNYQPLIRYRLGDVGVWDSATCACGRNMPIIKEVVGRVEDVVVAPDGRQLVRFHGIFTDQPNVREGQIIQETLQRIRVKIAPTNDFNLTDAQDITHRMQQRLGAQVEIIVEAVDSIPRTRAGKFQAVVSLLGDCVGAKVETKGIVETHLS